MSIHELNSGELRQNKGNIIMATMQQVGNHKTTIHVDSEGFTNIIYHNTPVVKFNHEKIILNTGGWSTNTTKARMNQASNQFALGYLVYQKNYRWYVEFKNDTIKFIGDTLELTR